ncbi:ArsR family transcriptional regulator [Calothrix sp. NIES-3974]|nr:ArsR family transcriptional regulator [Calothrix sp. NIES-3974]
MERLVEAVSMDWTTNLKRLEEMADRFRVMSDPTRLRILAVLGEQELSVQDICDRTGFKQSNVSKHLRVLREIEAIAHQR